MLRTIKIVTLFLLLAQVIVLCSYSVIFSQEKKEVKPPDVQHRPSIDNLKKTLAVSLSDFNGTNELAGKSDDLQKDTDESQDKYDEFHQISLKLNNDLFSNVLESIISLKMSVKELNVHDKKVMLTDKLHNKVLIVVRENNNQGIIEVFGSKSLIGGLLFSKTMNKVLAAMDLLSKNG